MPFHVLVRLWTEAEQDPVRVIIHSEVIAFLISHHERISAVLLCARWYRFSSTGGLLFKPPIEKRSIGIPRVESLSHNRTFVVTEEVAAIYLLLDLGAGATLFFEPDGLIKDLAGDETGLVKPRTVT